MSGVVLGMSVDAIVSTAGHASALVPAGVDWSAVEMFGAEVVFAYQVDGLEQRRRVECGLDVISSSDHIELLMSLPLGWPVPVSSLSHKEQSVLDRLPVGVVRVDDGVVERLAVAPLRVFLAIVPAARWRTGLERAGRFAPFTARMMWLPRVPTDVDDLVFQAARFGVGVVAGSSGQTRVLVPPAPFVRRRFTAAGWLFTEQVYARRR